jgi:hypothetical protein
VKSRKRREVPARHARHGRADGDCADADSAPIATGRDLAHLAGLEPAAGSGERARSLFLNGLELSAAWAAASRSPASSRRPDRPRQLPRTDAHRRIEREARPPMRCAGHRGRPPQLLDKWPLADGATLSASLPGAATPDRGHASFRALLRDTRQKGADLSLPVAAVAAECPD